MLPSHVPATDVATAVQQDGTRPALAPDCPPRLAAFLAECWRTRPDERPDAAAAVACFGDMLAAIAPT